MYEFHVNLESISQFTTKSIKLKKAPLFKINKQSLTSVDYISYLGIIIDKFDRSFNM